MTIYVQNNTSNDLKLNYKGEVYIFNANAISSVDETTLPYSMLLQIFGWSNNYPNLFLIAQPTQDQINSSVAALQEYVSVPIAVNNLLKSNNDVKGDSNKWRFEFALLEQALQNVNITTTPASSTPILAGGTGTGNDTLTVPASTVFSIQNTGNSSLSITINSITITVDALSSFEDTFNSFTSVAIVSTDSYNWYTK